MADSESSVLECQVTLEYLNGPQGSITRKITHKLCKLRLIRNEFREIFLEVSGANGGKITRNHLRDMKAHKKFMTEGKASITFLKDKLNILVSNAPPSQLFNFMKLMCIKMAKDDGTTTAKAKLLSTKSSSIEDISPLTDKDVAKAKAKLNIKDKTPTGAIKTMKRRLSDKTDVKAKKNCLMHIAEQVLSEEQREVLEAVKTGQNIFFTGSAGTGKSHLLRSIIAALPPDVTSATASTGVAACHIGGTTLHQFAGIGTGDGTLEHCIGLAMRTNVQSVWRRCQHLIIDEISMVHADLFDKLEHIARVVRRNERPFGGIQLILCGDFFQLPPVSSSVKFCFQAKVWEKINVLCFELQRVHRQSDPVLIDILRNIRIGHVTDEMTALLLKTSQQKVEKEGILATRLCTHTADALAINRNKLEELPGQAKTFPAIDSPEPMSMTIDKLCPVPASLTLKVGTQVMLMKNVNLAQGLANGARGVVLRFDNELPVVQFASVTQRVQRERFLCKTAGGALLVRVQLPLTLAWAFSIHKSQGLTLDCVEMSLAKVFEAGHAYVALSRVKSLDCLRVVDFNKKQVWANPEVLKYYQKFRRRMQAVKIVKIGCKAACS